MKKKIAVTALTTVGTMGLLSNAVNAEEIQYVDELPVIPEAKMLEEKKENVVPTEEDVNTAKTEYENAESDVKTQFDVVDKSKQDVVSAETELKNSQDDLEKLKTIDATPEAIESQKNLVKEDEKEVQKAEDELKEAEKEVELADKVVKEGQAVVDNDKKLVEDAKKLFEDSKKSVESAQKLVDGTLDKEIKAEADAAAKDLVSKTNYVTKAQENLESSKKFDQNLALEKTETENQIVKDKSNFAAAESDKNDKLAQLNYAKAQTSVAENNLNSLKAKYAATTTINLTDEYIQALKDHTNLNLSQEARKEAFDKLAAMNQKLVDMNKYVDDPEDSKVKFDTNNLPESFIQEMSLYAAKLINDIRAQLGTNPVDVSAGAIKYADMVSKEYANFTREQVDTEGHYTEGLKRVANTLGVPRGRENMSGYYYSIPQVSMSDAKKIIHDSVINFMFNGYEYNHANVLAGFLEKRLGEKEVFAVDFSSRKNITGTHFMHIVTNKITPESGFDISPIASPYKPAAEMLNDIKNAENVLAEKKNEQSAKQLAFDNSMKLFNDAINKLNESTMRLDSLNKVALKTPSAEKMLVDANNALDKAKTRDRLAKDALKSLALTKAERIEKLNKAKDELYENHKKLSKANNVLSENTAKLYELKAAYDSKAEKSLLAKTNLESKKDKLNKDKDMLYILENYDAVLAKAETRLTKAAEALVEANYNLSRDTVKLENFKTVLKEKEDVYKSKKLALDLHNEMKRLEQEALSKSQLEKNANKANINKSSVLPETGESAAILTGLMGLLSLIGGGFALHKKEQ